MIYLCLCVFISYNCAYSVFSYTSTFTKRTTVLQAVLLDRHLLGQLRQRLVDGVAAS